MERKFDLRNFTMSESNALLRADPLVAISVRIENSRKASETESAPSTEFLSR